MKHPEREELTEFLYKELPPRQQAEVAQHVAECQQCRSQLESWQAVRSELADWKIPAKRAAWAFAWPKLAPWLFAKWAVTAVVLLCAGYLLARLTDHSFSQADTTAMQAAIAKEIRQEVRAELAKFAESEGLRQEQLRDVFTKTLGRLEAQRLVDYAGLRRDMETVALRAEGEFLTTRQTLSELSDFENAKPAIIHP